MSDLRHSAAHLITRNGEASRCRVAKGRQRAKHDGPGQRVMVDNPAKILETIERLEAVAAGRSGPEADAFKAKAAELRVQLDEIAGSRRQQEPRQPSPPLNYADLTPAEQAALEIQLHQEIQAWEAEERAIFEWESRMEREKNRQFGRGLADRR